VAAAFREEWSRAKSKIKPGKKKRPQLSKAEEFALAATTQLGHLPAEGYEEMRSFNATP
jgi:hypothetical protein